MVRQRALIEAFWGRLVRKAFRSSTRISYSEFFDAQWLI